MTIGTDPISGKPIYKWFSGKSKKELKQKMMAYELSRQQSQNHEVPIPFSDIAEEWLRLKEGSCGESTYIGYDLCVRHLSQSFSHLFIQTISKRHIDDFFISKQDLSQSMVNKLQITVKSIFSYAIEEDYIVKNPCAAMKKKKGVAPKVNEPYDAEEIQKAIHSAVSHKDGLGPLIILKTGLRRGELLALKTKDFDLDKQRLQIRRTVVENKGVVSVKKRGKSDKALRTIPFDDELSEILRDIPVFTMKRSVFLFPNAKNPSIPIAPSNYIRRNYKRFITDSGLRPLNIHYLRHSYGTQLYRNGNDIYKIMKLMGHSSVEVTAKIYVHTTIEDLEKDLKL
ncbi:tyrosine-type recombinase/integrase [Eubacterium sp.]|uniref:tyrosine-type recombinase/integrase n=1 Tax=Eubacterium sp. TaxID=142586 RepID=UPI002FC593C1